MELRKLLPAFDSDCRTGCVICASSGFAPIELEDALARAFGDLEITIYLRVAASVTDQLSLDGALAAFEQAAVIGLWMDSGVGEIELELGLTARSGKLIIGSPQSAELRPIAEVMSSRFGIPLADSLSSFMRILRDRLQLRG